MPSLRPEISVKVSGAVCASAEGTRCVRGSWLVLRRVQQHLDALVDNAGGHGAHIAAKNIAFGIDQVGLRDGVHPEGSRSRAVLIEIDGESVAVVCEEGPGGLFRLAGSCPSYSR